MKCSAEAKIFCSYDAQMSHKHHKIKSPSTSLSWGHGDFSGSGCWNGWAETKSVKVEQLGGRHFSAAAAECCSLLLQYRAFLLTEITDTKNQMMPVTCTPDILKLLLLRMQNWQWKWQSYNILLLLLLFFSHSSKFLKPGVLQFMGSWRVGHDSGTEQQHNLSKKHPFSLAHGWHSLGPRAP